MEEWIRERGYVMWLGALGLAATEAADGQQAADGQAANGQAARDDRDEPLPRRDERPARTSEARPTR